MAKYKTPIEHGLHQKDLHKFNDPEHRVLREKSYDNLGREHLMELAEAIYAGDDEKDLLTLAQISVLIDRIAFLEADLERARKRIDAMERHPKLMYDTKWLESTVRAENQLMAMREKLAKLLQIDPLHVAKVDETKAKARVLEDLTATIIVEANIPRPEYDSEASDDGGDGDKES